MIWKRVIVAWMALLALVFASAGASARTDVDAKPHVGVIDVVAAICIKAHGLASVGGHQENWVPVTTDTSDVPHAARGAASAFRATGFASEKALNSPFAKHAAEWGAGNITKAGYLKRAQNLLNTRPGGNVLGHTRSSGNVLRYNTATNEFAAARADGTIKTLFRPADGAAYWAKQVAP